MVIIQYAPCRSKVDFDRFKGFCTLSNESMGWYVHLEIILWIIKSVETELNLLQARVQISVYNIPSLTWLLLDDKEL